MTLFPRYAPIPPDATRSTEELVRATLEIYVGARAVSLSDDLVNDLGITGEDSRELFQFLDHTFQATFSREKYRTIKTVGDLVYLYSRGINNSND